MTSHPPKVALLYPGDRAARDHSDSAASRFAALFEALAAAGVNAEPQPHRPKLYGAVSVCSCGVCLEGPS